MSDVVSFYFGVWGCRGRGECVEGEGGIEYIWCATGDAAWCCGSAEVVRLL